MDHDHGFQGIRGVFPESAGCPVASVVDEHVQPVETLDVFFNLFQFFSPGEFCNDDFNRSIMGFLQIFGAFCQFFLPASVENEVKPFLRQAVRKGCPNTAGSPCYESKWTVR